ncbi:MAG: TIGR04282 family arsenosugar biosynthesis glycosyltransferase [Steroidobacteraceae bacterium]
MQPTSASSPAATLVLFCRRPALGNGKQRLARSLGATAALAIAEALLECALEDAAAWPGPVVISPASAEDAAWAAVLTGDPERVLTQGEGNLGRRLNRVDASLRRRGCERVLFIGSDAPSLRPDDLCAAAQSLADADVVLVPAEDGGVTLVGSRVAWPDLTALPWSQSTLGAALERRCREARLSVVRLPGSYDVDEASDLPAAIAMLSSDDRPARARLRELLVAALRSSPAGPTEPAAAGRTAV